MDCDFPSASYFSKLCIKRTTRTSLPRRSLAGCSPLQPFSFSTFVLSSPPAGRSPARAGCSGARTACSAAGEGADTSCSAYSTGPWREAGALPRPCSHHRPVGVKSSAELGRSGGAALWEEAGGGTGGSAAGRGLPGEAELGSCSHTLRCQQLSRQLTPAGHLEQSSKR